MRAKRKRKDYPRVKVPGHPKAGKDGRVSEHILVMEKQLGRFLTKDECVHHKNEDIKDNSPSNLELCPNNAYHRLLHVKMAALAACGNEHYRKCCYCKQYDDVKNLVITSPKSTVYHVKCSTEQSRAYRERRFSNG